MTRGVPMACWDCGAVHSVEKCPLRLGTPTDKIMTMLRNRAEDGRIHISDPAVEMFICDAIGRILKSAPPAPDGGAR